MDYSLLIAYLRQKQYITDLEKDILDTWNELQKSPFDRSSAQLQIMQNNAKHPEILAANRQSINCNPSVILLCVRCLRNPYQQPIELFQLPLWCCFPLAPKPHPARTLAYWQTLTAVPHSLL